MVGPMITDEIDGLLALQDIDAKLASLDRALQRMPAKITALDERIQEAQGLVDAAVEARSAAQLEQRKLASDIQQLQADKGALLTKQASVKTNDEYFALTREIEGADKSVSDAEDRLLELLEGEGEFDAAVSRAEAAKAEVEAEVSGQRREIEAEQARLETDRSTAVSDREAAFGQVGDAARTEYERLCKKKQGVALVRVTNDSCGGCYQAVPPQKIAEAKLRKNIVYCEYCGRILTWENAGA